MSLLHSPAMIEVSGCLAIGGLVRMALWSACLLGAVWCVGDANADDAIHWERLPPIPDAEGFASSFAGVSNGALIVAGGANIAGDKWAEPLRKQWYDSVFVLEKPDGEWKRGFAMPRALGYGVSVTTERGVVCVGGSDSQRHHTDVFLLEWRGGRIVMTPMPALPKPCANACGAIVGKMFYIAGGIERPDATVAMKTFWRLDLAASEPRWESLEPWPGPERMLAVAGSNEDSFYIFSGTRLSAGADGKPARDYLRDAYRFTAGKGWIRIADLPRAAVAAPSPVLSGGGARLLIVSGDDGANVNFTPVREHPGFPRDVIAYDSERDVWSRAGEAPFSRATVPVVHWLGRDVIPNGEARPRVRTPEVWTAKSR